jgi:hypothetical protein
MCNTVPSCFSCVAILCFFLLSLCNGGLVDVFTYTLLSNPPFISAKMLSSPAQSRWKINRFILILF